MSHIGVNLIHEAQCDPQSLYPLSCSTCEAARAGRRYPDKNEGEQVNIDELMTRAALECIDERERHLAIYSVGLNAYVCRNEAVVDESRALFKGTYRDCQVWIERKGISAALMYVTEHVNEVPELTVRGMTSAEILALLSLNNQIE